MKKRIIDVCMLTVFFLSCSACGKTESENLKDVESQMSLEKSDMDNIETLTNETEPETNKSDWKYYASARYKDVLLYTRKFVENPISNYTAYTNAHEYMLRKYFENVSGISFEEWIEKVSNLKDNEFGAEVKRLTEELGYDKLTEEQKAFLNYYIMTSFFKYENINTLGKVQGDVYIINYDGYSTFNLEDGSTVVAPKEMVFSIDGLSELESEGVRAGITYFNDLKNPDRHCVYCVAVSSKKWNLHESGKYVFSELNKDLVLNEEALDSLCDKLGFLYVANDGRVITLTKQSGEEFNQLLDRYDELICLMRDFSEEVFLPYYEEYKQQQHEEYLENEKEEEEWRNKIPQVGMTKDEVIKTGWGVPDSKNITEYRWGVSEQWVYDNKGYVYFENGVVTSVSRRE